MGKLGKPGRDIDFNTPISNRKYDAHLQWIQFNEMNQ